MKNLASILRVTGITLIAFILMEIILKPEEGLAIQKYPIAWLVLGGVLLFAVAIEVCIAALEKILFQNLKEDARERYLAAEKLRNETRSAWIKNTYHKLQGSHSLAEEEEIVLDHNYDGIRELDNKLPPWWLYGFYASMIFALVYFLRFQVFDGPTQEDEYLQEVAQAKVAVAEYKKAHKDEIDANTVELLTDAEDIKAGKAIFTNNCIPCHKEGGAGGIGPNLTDDYWILGGGIKNVFHTITEGGRAGKGMISWKTTFKPGEIAQVASYVISLHGTNPPNAKEPQGELWTGSNAKEHETETVKDSIHIEEAIENTPATGSVNH